MSDLRTESTRAHPKWRGPLISLALLLAAYFLLAFSGLTVLLVVPVIIGAWSIMNLRTNKWYWALLVPCMAAIGFFLYLFVVFSVGFIFG